MSNACFYRNNQRVSFDTFCHDISATRKNIALHSSQNVMLFHIDSYQFTVLLFALIIEGKHVYLPPNSQIGTLETIAQQCDITIGDIKLENKPYIETPSLTDKTTNCASTASINQLFSLFSGQITFFTSGSTGQPKAIVKSCQQLTCELETLSKAFSDQFNHCNAFVSTVSHQHIYGLLFKILLPLRLGKTIVNKTFEYPEHINTNLAELIFESSATKKKNIILISSPAHLKRLVFDNVLSKHSAHYCAMFSSGGLLPFEASQLLTQQMGQAPIEVLGSTETGGIAWRNEQQNQHSPWQVFPNIKYEIHNDTSCLAIFSPYVDKQPYITDDKIEPIDDTHFILKGRMDRTVKIEEKRVNLDHIEQCLMTHSWVNDAKVFMIKNRQSVVDRNILSCALEITKSAEELIKNQGKRSLNDKFKQHLLNDVERICLPKKWRYLDKFPYNSQGKLVLSDLENLFD